MMVFVIDDSQTKILKLLDVEHDIIQILQPCHQSSCIRVAVFIPTIIL